MGCCSSNIVKSIEKVSVGMIVGRLVYDGSFESVYEKTLFSGVSHWSLGWQKVSNVQSPRKSL